MLILNHAAKVKDLQSFTPRIVLLDINRPPPEARIHVRFGPRTPGGVRGYGKICLLTEALTQFRLQ